MLRSRPARQHHRNTEEQWLMCPSRGDVAGGDTKSPKESSATAEQLLKAVILKKTSISVRHGQLVNRGSVGADRERVHVEEAELAIVIAGGGHA